MTAERPGSGRLFVVTAPSGAGKSSLCKELIASVPGLRFSTSHTTRGPRPLEADGRDYHFISRDEFRAQVDAGRLAEWTEIHGNLYGTSMDELESARAEGFDLILDIEGRGAAQIRAKWPNSVFIFVIPPSLSELRERLYGRDSDPREEIEMRLKSAAEEITYLPNYDYIIINEDFDEAVFRLVSIVVAERSRRDSQIDRLPEEFRPRR
ncbi:guanylate kinase [bacterium]|nr:guanylate kinase [bacterium]